MARCILSRIINKSAVLLIAILLLSACGEVVRTGVYSPIGVYPTSNNKLPISLRTVGIVQAGSKNESFNEGELRRMEVELANSIISDIMTMGQFRAPLPGEKPYLLDVEFPELSMMYMSGFLVKHKGEAVFQLYSPKEILVHETVTHEERLYPYYGNSQSFANLNARLVEKFKSDCFEHIGPIRMQKQIDSIYGKFKGRNAYDHNNKGIIINSGSTQFNNIGRSNATQIDQKNNLPSKTEPRMKQ